MLLPPDRAGPYLRALQAGLVALGPDEAHVPLQRALDHLAALDPALSGPLLAPAELDPQSGLPAFAWLMRARAERELAREGGPASATDEAEIDAVAGRDPALAERLRARNALHRFLRGAALLAPSRLSVALRRIGPDHLDLLLVFDRLAPDGTWQRVQADLRGPPGLLAGPAFRAGPGGAPVADPGVLHLLVRHGPTALPALRQSLSQGTGTEVLRLSRGQVGPFWFPGGPGAAAPACMKGALVLHLVCEQLGPADRPLPHRDPLVRPLAPALPAGQKLDRERRFAVSPGAVDAVRAWAEAAGAPTVVVGLAPGGAARRS